MKARDIAALTAVSRASAQAEFALWRTVLSLHEQRVDEIDREDSTSMFKRMAVNAAALEIAQALQISEQQVWRVVAQAGRLREQLPQVWAAFADGRIGSQKASTLAVVVERLTLAETRAVLDGAAIDYAETHTPTELRRWADQLADRLEPVALDDADRERHFRRVEVDHGRKGVSHLMATLPTLYVVAVMKRLRAAARTLPDDGRTLDQKVADLFVSFLTNATGTDIDIRAEVAVVVEAEALAGVTDAPALVDPESNDPAPIPPRWVLELAEQHLTLWTQLLTDRKGRVFDVRRIGYQPPESLRHATRWRDLRCIVRGCSRAAEESDLDHEKPFDAGGDTSGRNLNHKCRRHHGMKGHGVLPPHVYRAAEPLFVRLPASPLVVEYVEAA